jgi:hypothetical protein
MPPLLRNEASNIFKGRDREHLKSNSAELTVYWEKDPIYNISFVPTLLTELMGDLIILRCTIRCVEIKSIKNLNHFPHRLNLTGKVIRIIK